MNYSQIRKYDVANGLGIRSTLFVTGCTHKCAGCFNHELWDFKSGQLFDDDAKNLLFEYLSDEHVRGLSVLGGEPLQQDEELYDLLKEVKEKFPSKDIWLWTGYDVHHEGLTKLQQDILSLCDVIIDGRFDVKLRDIKLKFRGSSNQTIYERDKDGNLVRSILND